MFYDKSNELPESVCSRPCSPGQRVSLLPLSSWPSNSAKRDDSVLLDLRRLRQEPNRQPHDEPVCELHHRDVARRDPDNVSDAAQGDALLDLFRTSPGPCPGRPRYRHHPDDRGHLPQVQFHPGRQEHHEGAVLYHPLRSDHLLCRHLRHSGHSNGHYLLPHQVSSVVSPHNLSVQSPPPDRLLHRLLRPAH